MKFIFCGILLLIPPFTGMAVTLAEKQAIVNQLNLEIQELDKQLIKCKKNKTVWQATTATGSIGNILTGIGIVSKAKQLKQLNADTQQKTEGEGNDQ